MKEDPWPRPPGTAVIAESDDTVVVEGNHYFPRACCATTSRPSDTHTVCPWKGTARYYSLEVDGELNQDAVWYYPSPRTPPGRSPTASRSGRASRSPREGRRPARTVGRPARAGPRSQDRRPPGRRRPRARQLHLRLRPVALSRRPGAEGPAPDGSRVRRRRRGRRRRGERRPGGRPRGGALRVVRRHVRVLPARAADVVRGRRRLRLPRPDGHARRRGSGRGGPRAGGRWDARPGAPRCLDRRRPHARGAPQPLGRHGHRPPRRARRPRAARLTVAVVGDGAVGLCGVLAAAGSARSASWPCRATRPGQEVARRSVPPTSSTSAARTAPAPSPSCSAASGPTRCSSASAARVDAAGADDCPRRRDGRVRRASRTGSSCRSGSCSAGTSVGGGVAPVRAYLPELLAAWSRARSTPAGVRHELPLDEVADGYRAMHERRAIKVLLRP